MSHVYPPTARLRGPAIIGILRSAQSYHECKEREEGADTGQPPGLEQSAACKTACSTACSTAATPLQHSNNTVNFTMRRMVERGMDGLKSSAKEPARANRQIGIGSCGNAASRASTIPCREIKMDSIPNWQPLEGWVYERREGRSPTESQQKRPEGVERD